MENCVKKALSLMMLASLSACGGVDPGSSSESVSSSSLSSSSSSISSSSEPSSSLASSSASSTASGLCSDSDYLCLDFESGNPEGIAFGNFARIESTSAVSGSNALYFFTNNKNDGNASWYGGFISTTSSVPATHWGRMSYRIETFANPDTYSHLTLMAAQMPSTDVRLVDIVRGPDGTHQYLYNFPDDTGGKISTYDWSIDDNWVCVEWHVDSASQTFEFYREGVRVDAISGSVAGDHGGIPSEYGKLYFGGQVYQQTPDIAGWIDDIVVGPQRKPCP